MDQDIKESIKVRIENDIEYLNENHLFREGGLKSEHKNISVNIESVKRQAREREEKGYYRKPQINLLVKTAELEKAQKSKKHANAVERSNIANTVKSMKLLIEHGIETMDDLDSVNIFLQK